MITPEQLKEEILVRITRAGMGRNSPLPSLRALSREYATNPSLVHKAVSMLKVEGVLETVQGRGTFLAGSMARASRRKVKVIGLDLAREPEFIKELYEEWLARGWFLALYISSKDAQSASRERLFLEKAFDEGFVGVALHPTPLEGTNLALCDKLRKGGMRIVFLSSAQSGLTNGCFCCLDHEHAGYQAAVQMTLRGYRQLTFCHQEARTVYQTQQRDGMGRAAQEFGLRTLEDVIMPAWTAETDSFERALEIFVETNLPLVDTLKSLPPDTGLVVSQSDTAEVLRRLLVRAGRDVPGDIGLCYCLRDMPLVSGLSGAEFPERQQIQCALEFIANNAGDSEDSIQRWFTPVFVPRATTR
ncbi:MAG: GntR family transcriptional regulator [Phycisphaeraceae bacterium]|nr:GntR family transcriptional regulator [Phycisphaeraceae bacterium]